MRVARGTNNPSSCEVPTTPSPTIPLEQLTSCCCPDPFLVSSLVPSLVRSLMPSLVPCVSFQTSAQSGSLLGRFHRPYPGSCSLLEPWAWGVEPSAGAHSSLLVRSAVRSAETCVGDGSLTDWYKARCTLNQSCDPSCLTPLMLLIPLLLSI